MKRILAIALSASILLSIASCGSTVPIRVDTVGHYNKHKGRKGKVKKSRSQARTHVVHSSKTEVRTRSKVTAERKAIVSTAKNYLHIPYKYGGKSPESGFDCSGFTSYVYQRNGINLKGNSNNQASSGIPKKWKDIETGDLLIFGKGKKVSHVAIVAHKDDRSLRVLHSTSSRGVVEEDISNSDYWQNKFLFARDVLQ